MEYESVKRGWAYVGEDGILRPRTNLRNHPRTCGLCEERWHDGPCNPNARVFRSSRQHDLSSPDLPAPPDWLIALAAIGVGLAVILVIVVALLIAA